MKSTSAVKSMPASLRRHLTRKAEVNHRSIEGEILHRLERSVETDLAPVMVLLLHRYAAWGRKRQIALFAAPELIAGLMRSHSPVRRALKNLLLVFAIAGMGLALARPQWGETAEVSRALGEDILFLVDCSKSMLATDVRPSRIDRAKYAILDFVQRHGSGRVGLIAFS